MSSETNITFAVAAALPDGNGGYSPCPELLTADEAIRYLRLDTTGAKNPRKSLSNLIANGLKPVQVGRNNFFRREALGEFLKMKQKR